MIQMEWKTIAEDSAKKVKTQQRRQEIPSLSAMTQLDVDVLWLGITLKSGNEQPHYILTSFHFFSFHITNKKPIKDLLLIMSVPLSVYPRYHTLSSHFVSFLPFCRV